nr:SRPBCC domain-containing protein [uncultured Cohaesibacter sp.]
MLKPIVKVIEVPTDAATAYDIFVDFSGWWPLETRSISFHTTNLPAKRIDLDPKPGGAIVGIGSDDTRHVWGVFADCDAPSSLAIDFHMGHPKEHATHLVVSFIMLAEEATMVKLVHTGWESYGALSHMMRKGYEEGWDDIFVQAYAGACQRAKSLCTKNGRIRTNPT